jgi:hypothetical protein
MERVRNLAKAAFLAAIVVAPAAFLALYLPARLTTDELRADPVVYATAAQHVQEGASMYDPLPPPGPHRFGQHYLYPPLFAVVLSWLPQPTPLAVQRVLYVLGIAGIFAMGLGLAILARWPRVRGALAVVAFTVLLPPLVHALDAANLAPAVWGLAALGVALPSAIGASLLVLGAATKIVPAWPLLVLLVRIPGRTVPAALVTVAVCAIAVILTLGPARMVAETATWIEHVVPTLGQGQFVTPPYALRDGSLSGFWSVVIHANFSPVFAPLRLFGDPYPGELGAAARLYLAAMSLGFPAVGAYATRRRATMEQAAIVLALATLASPILRITSVPFLFPATVVLLRGRWRNTAGSTAAKHDAAEQTR